MLRLLVVPFALSGAAGLIYESTWSRHLDLFLGHSAYAQVHGARHLPGRHVGGGSRRPALAAGLGTAPW
jgi:hypothetical protein